MSVWVWVTRTGDVVVGAATMVILMSCGLFTVTPVAAPETVAPAVTVVAPVRDTREHVPTDEAPFYGAYVAPEDVADVFEEIDAPLSVEIAALRSLVNGGAVGAVNDTGDFIYARVGTVRVWSDGAETGIVAMTYWGPAICVDGETGECDSGMYLTDYYLWGVETNEI